MNDEIANIMDSTPKNVQVLISHELMPLLDPDSLAKLLDHAYKCFPEGKDWSVRFETR